MAVRIVSLLPSATEIVCALGLRDWLVGVSHECDHPASVASLPRVTRALVADRGSSGEIDRAVRQAVVEDRPLYALEGATLARLRPDLIVTQSLCGVCAIAGPDVDAALEGLPGSPRVLTLSPSTLADGLAAIEEVGAAARLEPRRTARVVARLRERVETVAARSGRAPHRPRVVFLEWLDPLFCGGHWNPELVHLAGGDDALGAAGCVSRVVGWEEVTAAGPEVVFVAACGLDVARTLRDVPRLATLTGWPDLAAVRRGRVLVADGSQYFNRPGPRLVDSLEILAHALHPELHPLPEGLPEARTWLDRYVSEGRSRSRTTT